MTYTRRKNSKFRRMLLIVSQRLFHLKIYCGRQTSETHYLVFENVILLEFINDFPVVKMFLHAKNIIIAETFGAGLEFGHGMKQIFGQADAFQNFFAGSTSSTTIAQYSSLGFKADSFSNSWSVQVTSKTRMFINLLRCLFGQEKIFPAKNPLAVTKGFYFG